MLLVQGIMKAVNGHMRLGRLISWSIISAIWMAIVVEVGLAKAEVISELFFMKAVGFCSFGLCFFLNY